MSLLTDVEITEAVESGTITIDPFDKDRHLQPASYDLRLGKNAIITRSISLDELRGKVERDEAKELNVERERSISIPPGGFALVTTLEKIKLPEDHAGHIGLSTYYVRKGLSVLSGLQIDPGWEGVLVLGLCNLSTRAVVIDYGDTICTIEIHKLIRQASKAYSGPYMADQREGRIPKADKDYLRMIETMSVSDLTKALITISSSVDKLSRMMWFFWIPLGIAVVASIISAIAR